MLEICAIASGSNGNCYYIGNNTDAILIDAGLSGKQIINRMNEVGLNPAKIKAVFITHEHGDHMRGARGVSKKLHVPIYITSKTFFGAYKNMRPDSPNYFTPDEEIEVGEFTVYPVQKNHDAAEPCSFRIKYNNKNIGVFTDIGEACENVKSHISICDALFLESNYDEKMLWDGVYPYFLKQRVASELGHLSNDQTFELLEKHTNGNLQCVFLSHISKENNTPEKALERMGTLADKFEVKLASRYEASEVYTIK
ncbi:MBL fold metallo-hydrolase [uncultured Draconibacterium sp.]|uniref:MBL fold metallo-hydrolase n=1 Tax=uncultured Draconibacterium sp. TaxID=1573823 RepID=UPI003216EB5C